MAVRGQLTINQNVAASALASIQKAIGDTAVVGAALVREDLQDQLVVAAPIETPLRNKLGRIQGNGTAHAYYVLKRNTDASQGPFFGTTPGNGVFPKGGLPVQSVEQYDYISTPYFNIGDIVQVTFQDQAQGRSYTDLRRQRINIHLKNAAMMEEFWIINGDSSVVQAGGGRVFDGLIKQITTRGGQVVTPSDGKLNVGLVRTLQEQQWEAGASPDAVVMDGLGQAILTAQIAQFYAIRGMAAALSDMSAGISVRAYDFGYGPCDFIRDRYLVPNSYNGQRYFMSLTLGTMDMVNDGNVIRMVDVDPMGSIDLAIVDTSWKTLVYETTALEVTVPQFQGLVTGLTYSGQSAATG